MKKMNQESAFGPGSSASMLKVGAGTAVLRTVAQMATAQPAFSRASLRHWIFHAEGNGLAKSGALIRLGRKILIDEVRFLEWVRSHSTSAAA